MTIDYNGFTAKVDLDVEHNLLVGRVLGIRDEISFHAEAVSDLMPAFVESVTDYLEYCEELGVEPSRQYSGNLTLRLGPELHQRVEIAAVSQDVSMNEWLIGVVRSALVQQEHRVTAFREAPGAWETAAAQFGEMFHSYHVVAREFTVKRSRSTVTFEDPAQMIEGWPGLEA